MNQPLCIVIGMGAGVSFAVANRFAQENFQTAMVGRNRQSLYEFEQKLQDAGFSAKGFVGDATDENSLQKAMTETEETLGECEVLIYNAYGLTAATASEVSLEDFRRDTEANLFAPLASAREVLPAMKRRGRGTLLFTGGGAGLDAYPAWASLSVGKAALRSLVFNLHAELSPLGIHAATVTIAGTVGGGSPNLEPASIAEHFWNLHRQSNGNFEREIIVRG
jgi:NAD(P)-dependent dehydrogenase (short-subunit alcohol dehydrogenase family)